MKHLCEKMAGLEFKTDIHENDVKESETEQTKN
jgi:hypothetical protein